jgi:hypothetical protein
MAAIFVFQWWWVEQGESTFQSLFQGLRKSFAVDGEQSVWSYTDWKAGAIDQYTKEDPILQRLLLEERAKDRKE